MKIKTIKDKLFHNTIIISCGGFKEISKWLSKRDIDLVYNKRWGAFSGRLPSGEYHLHFDMYGFSVIVHETHHASLDILNEAGLNCNQETKEVFAYYQDWLAGQVRDVFEKWNKQKKKKGSK